MPTPHIVFVVYDGFQCLDLTGPYEVFSKAGYRLSTVSAAGGLVTASNGLPVQMSYSISDLAPKDIDTLVVVGGAGLHHALHDTALIEWIAQAGAAARRVTSVCTGTFLLAAANLLDGHRVTTHWNAAHHLARMFPALTVDCDPVYIKDGRVWTSAGVTAGMDLALALVEDDQGRAKAHTIARNLVLFLRRPGSQSQFSAAMRADPPADGPIRTVVDAVHANPGGQHGISELAVVGGLSERHLQRRFTAELGVPPAAYVEQVRVEAAATALTEDNKPVDVIARRCGFGTAESMRRAFHRQRGISPSEYRDRFTTTKEFA